MSIFTSAFQAASRLFAGTKTGETVAAKETGQYDDPREKAIAEQIQVLDQDEEKARIAQSRKGKLSARERLNLLLDEGSWLEISPFKGGEQRRAAVLTGIGNISGRQVAVYAQDFSIQGGTLGKIEGEKILHLLEQALSLQIPVIALLDSGGARIQEGVAALSQYGRIFKKTCQASGIIPQISIILGPCAGGAVYCPALTDFIIMTRETSHMFVTGPEVVRAATGEEVSFAQLGGGQIHNEVSGVAHYLAQDEADAIEYARALLDYLPSSCRGPLPHYTYLSTASDDERAASIGALVPESERQPYDMTQVIKNLVDHGEFVEVHELFAPCAIVGLACIEGMPVGIVANQPMVDGGTLNVDASEKVARFVQFCDAFGLPIVTLVDVPGYRPGTDQEQAGIIRRGAKVISSYANATVPMVSVVLRKAYGGAYIVMGSKSMGADFNYAWPGAQIAVLGAEGAVNILRRRELAQAEKEGKDVGALRTEFIDQYTASTINTDLSVQTGEIDALIAPSQTRRIIAQSLQVTRGKSRGARSIKFHANGPL